MACKERKVGVQGSRKKDWTSCQHSGRRFCFPDSLLPAFEIPILGMNKQASHRQDRRTDGWTERRGVSAKWAF